MFCVSDATIDKPYCAHNHDHLIAPSYHVTGNIGQLHGAGGGGCNISETLRPVIAICDWYASHPEYLHAWLLRTFSHEPVPAQCWPSNRSSVKSHFVIYKTTEIKAWQQINSISTLPACSPPAPHLGTRGPRTWLTPGEPPARDTGTPGTGEVVFTLVRWHRQYNRFENWQSTMNLIDPFHIVYSSFFLISVHTVLKNVCMSVSLEYMSIKLDEFWNMWQLLCNSIQLFVPQWPGHRAGEWQRHPVRGEPGRPRQQQAGQAAGVQVRGAGDKHCSLSSVCVQPLHVLLLLVAAAGAGPGHGLGAGQHGRHYHGVRDRLRWPRGQTEIHGL